MKNKSKYQSEIKLIISFLKGELHETERDQFNKWLNKKPENQTLFDETKKIWENSENLSSLLSTDTNKDWQKTNQRIGFADDAKTISLPAQKTYLRMWRVAAVIFILIGIGLSSKQFLFAPSEMLLVQTGDYTKEIVLPDGSMAFLNDNSTLQYPKKFKRKSREVKLSGEGFFEVTKNIEKKFRININEQAFIEVLGTSFNINSAKENGAVDVHVVSGKVAFYTPGNKGAQTILVKNENASLSKGIISKNTSADKNFQSWRTGIIVFDEEAIEDVCKVLSAYYKTNIVAPGLESSELRFTSTIDNQKLESVLEEIKLVLKLDYKKDGKNIIIHCPD